MLRLLVDIIVDDIHRVGRPRCLILNGIGLVGWLSTERGHHKGYRCACGKRGLYRAARFYGAPGTSDAGAGDTSATRSSRRSADVSPPWDCPLFSASVEPMRCGVRGEPTRVGVSNCAGARPWYVALTASPGLPLRVAPVDSRYFGTCA